MWISRKKWNQLQKRITDLERSQKELQGQFEFDAEMARTSLNDVINHFGANHDSVPKSAL